MFSDKHEMHGDWSVWTCLTGYGCVAFHAEMVAYCHVFWMAYMSDCVHPLHVE